MAGHVAGMGSAPSENSGLQDSEFPEHISAVCRWKDMPMQFLHKQGKKACT